MTILYGKIDILIDTIHLNELEIAIYSKREGIWG